MTSGIMIYDFNNTIEDFFLVRTMISDLELHMIANRIIADIHFRIRQFLGLSVTICKSPLLCFRIYPDKALMPLSKWQVYHIEKMSDPFLWHVYVFVCVYIWNILIFTGMFACHIITYLTTGSLILSLVSCIL